MIVLLSLCYSPQLPRKREQTSKEFLLQSEVSEDDWHKEKRTISRPQFVNKVCENSEQQINM